MEAIGLLLFAAFMVVFSLKIYPKLDKSVRILIGVLILLTILVTAASQFTV